jgi:hypothetical protein
MFTLSIEGPCPSSNASVRTVVLTDETIAVTLESWPAEHVLRVG